EAALVEMSIGSVEMSDGSEEMSDGSAETTDGSALVERVFGVGDEALRTIHRQGGEVIGLNVQIDRTHALIPHIAQALGGQRAAETPALNVWIDTDDVYLAQR